jgi:hypothetical protein
MAHNAANHPKGNHKTRLTETLAILMLVIGAVLVGGFLILQFIL